MMDNPTWIQVLHVVGGHHKEAALLRSYAINSIQQSCGGCWLCVSERAHEHAHVKGQAKGGGLPEKVTVRDRPKSSSYAVFSEFLVLSWLTKATSTSSSRMMAFWGASTSHCVVPEVHTPRSPRQRSRGKAHTQSE
jgi:hypothetical protein